jgi:hypothetical protein
MPEISTFNVRTILLPVDFSDGNLSAARQAGVLARRFNATVILLHVNELPPWLRSLPNQPEDSSSRADPETIGDVRNRRTRRCRSEAPRNVRGSCDDDCRLR